MMGYRTTDYMEERYLYEINFIVFKALSAIRCVHCDPHLFKQYAPAVFTDAYGRYRRCRDRPRRYCLHMEGRRLDGGLFFTCHLAHDLEILLVIKDCTWLRA